MGRNGESGALGLGAARGGVELGVGARFARFGTGAGTSNVASEPLRDRTLGDAVDESHESGAPRAFIYPSIKSCAAREAPQKLDLRRAPELWL